MAKTGQNLNNHNAVQNRSAISNRAKGVRSVVCPKCGSEPGIRCMMEQGKFYYAHIERYQAYSLIQATKEKTQNALPSRKL